MKAITNENNQKLNPKDCIKDVFEIDLPNVPAIVLGSAGIQDFPNVNANSTKYLLFIKENGSVTLNDLFDKFGTISYVGVFRFFDIIKRNMVDDTYSLTEYGENMIKLINWFAPVYELIDFVNNANVANVDELDIQLTMAGKHSLINKDVVERVRMISCDGINTLGRNVHEWVSKFLRMICYEINFSYNKIFRELFKRLDSNELAV